MSNENSNNNVIQFPGRKKEAEASQAVPTPPAPKKTRKARGSKKNVGATVVAIILASAAVNSYVFSQSTESLTQTSSGGRNIASVEPSRWNRDADWEKALAEKLASPQVRSIASTRIGRPASTEDKLRWGILEEKYTIAYNSEDHRIRTIMLQDETAAPSYVLDREEFLKEYGALFESDFKIAKLKSVETSDGKTVESYTLIRDNDQPGREARFELDRHKRLLSLKVESSEI